MPDPAGAPVGTTKSTKANTTSTSAKAPATTSSSSSSKTKESAIPATNADSTPETNGTLSHTTPRRTLFYDMLTTLARDAVDFRNLLHVVIHFMEHTLTLQQEIQSDVMESNPSGIAAISVNPNPLLYKIEPMVLISDQTRVTRMICPSLNVIEQHSARLATLVKVISLIFFTSFAHTSC